MGVSSDIKKEAWSHFQDYQTVLLATAEGGHPRVRPVTLINYDDKLWIATGANSAKVKEMRGNPNIEFCLQFQGEAGGGYVRIAGLGEASRRNCLRIPPSSLITGKGPMISATR